ncbi:MAG: ComF family protein [Chloroflexota bacterium]
MSRGGRAVVDLLFPRRCVGCGKTGDFLCSRCLSSLPCLGEVCPRCGRPQAGGNLCPGCWVWQNEIDGIRSVFRFDGAVRKAIHQFKYDSLKALAGPLALLLAGYLKSKPLPVEVLVPVPLHLHRLKERGYNQSALLARETGKLTSLPVIEDTLRRLKDSPRQARSASVAERRRNVVGAFRCTGSGLAGKRTLLIDDVCTSGATLEACAAAAKDAGAASVWGLTVAREA